MSRIVHLSGDAKPTGFLKRMRKAKRLAEDVSESTRGEVLAKRWVLGKRVHFYTNGDHIIKSNLAGEGLTDQEQYDSEILRFAHASILIGEPVGDKRKLWINAGTKDSDHVQIYIDGKPIRKLINETKSAISLAQSIDSPNFLELK